MSLSNQQSKVTSNASVYTDSDLERNCWKRCVFIQFRRRKRFKAWCWWNKVVWSHTCFVISLNHNCSLHPRLSIITINGLSRRKLQWKRRHSQCSFQRICSFHGKEQHARCRGCMQLTATFLLSYWSLSCRVSKNLFKSEFRVTGRVMPITTSLHNLT